MECLEGRRHLSSSAVPVNTSFLPEFSESDQPYYVTGTAAALRSTTLPRLFTKPVTAKINWGDGTAVERRVPARELGLVDAFSGAVYQTSLSMDASHVYAAPGVYAAVVTYQYRGRRLLRETQTFDVWQNSPGGRDLNAYTNLGDGVNGPIGTFTHHSFTAGGTAVGPIASVVASIDWGDGSPRSDGALERLEDGSIQVTGSHKYTETGQFRVTAYAFVGFGDRQHSGTLSVPVVRSTAWVSMFDTWGTLLP